MYKLLKKVKEINPLVLHYTNNVTITDCANTTLAIGASPLMSFSYEEVDDIVRVASSVVINIGTMNSELLDLYVLAGKTANKYNKPVILDPVGVFATKARTDLTNRLLNEVKFDVIRGNISEIQFIGGLDVKGKGVDSFDDGSDPSFIVKEVAKKLECVVVASG
ncbi:MAG TPA: hydroxyethylthiazole kinase, partial [Terrisporobacter glycolicus]